MRAQEQQGVLLGLAGGSSAALRDFNLGQVSCHWCCHPAHFEVMLVPDNWNNPLHPVLQLKCRRFLSGQGHSARFVLLSLPCSMRHEHAVPCQPGSLTMPVCLFDARSIL